MTEDQRKEHGHELERITNQIYDALYGCNKADAMLATLLVLSTQLDEAAERAPHLLPGFSGLREEVESHIQAAMNIWGLKWGTLKIQVEEPPTTETVGTTVPKREEPKHGRHCHRTKTAPGTETTPA